MPERRPLAPSLRAFTLDASTILRSLRNGMGAFPETVGRYRILRVLGRGGMGVTYEGAPIDGGPRVAIKQLQLSRMDDWKVVELFEREARVLANVTHPAVPTYIEFLPADPAGDTASYLLQQLAPGRSLADLVASGWRADEAEARRIAEGLLDVLEYLHARTPVLAPLVVRGSHAAVR